MRVYRVPIQTLFDPNPEGGVVAVALTPDARYLATLSAGSVQVLAIWDWTIDGETPICSADLQPSYGVQNYIHFNPEDIHHLVTNSDTQVLFFQWVSGVATIMLQLLFLLNLFFLSSFNFYLDFLCLLPIFT